MGSAPLDSLIPHNKGHLSTQTYCAYALLEAACFGSLSTIDCTFPQQRKHQTSGCSYAAARWRRWWVFNSFCFVSVLILLAEDANVVDISDDEPTDTLRLSRCKNGQLIYVSPSILAYHHNRSHWYIRWRSSCRAVKAEQTETYWSASASNLSRLSTFAPHESRQNCQFAGRSWVLAGC